MPKKKTKNNKDKWQNYKNCYKPGVILWSVLLIPDFLENLSAKQISSGSIKLHGRLTIKYPKMRLNERFLYLKKQMNYRLPQSSARQLYFK